MNRKELYDLIDENVNEIFAKYQKANNIKSGYISPDDALKLDNIQNNLADLIISVCENNK